MLMDILSGDMNPNTVWLREKGQGVKEEKQAFFPFFYKMQSNKENRIDVNFVDITNLLYLPFRYSLFLQQL